MRRTGIDPATITHAIGCGEEAVGDRYQRGGGNVAKAIAESCELTGASAIDVKSFCAAPIHALVVAAALLEAGIERRVVVVAGGSLAKLGMKFEGALTAGYPILEDVLAGVAILLEPSDGSNGPVLRTDAIGRMPVGAGAAPQAQLGALVGEPLDALGVTMSDVGTYATEIHNPEITEPQGGGDVADRNYRMLAGLGVVRGELDTGAIPGFARAHGMPGFAPTQGHIASAVPWLPHALARMAAGDLHRTMLIAKGSLFLGRLTRLWDGASVVLGDLRGDAVIEATVDTFEELAATGPVLVDIWGPQCQPCLALMPAVEALAERFGDRVRFLSVNAPDNRKVCRDLRVAGLPAYLTMRDGVEVERLTSNGTTPEQIEAAIERLLDGAPAVGPPTPEHLRQTT